MSNSVDYWGVGGVRGQRVCWPFLKLLEACPPAHPHPHPCSPLTTPKMWDKSKHVYIGYVGTIYVAESCDGFIRLSLVHTVKQYP